MTDRVSKFIATLPQCQRKTADRKVAQAVAMGWDEDAIELCTPIGVMPHHYDLMGIHPVSGKKTLLPDES